MATSNIPKIRPTTMEVAAAVKSDLVAAVRGNDPTAIERCVHALQTVYDGANAVMQYKLLTEAIDTRCVLLRPLLRDALSNNASALVRHEAAFGLGILGDSSDCTVLCRSVLSDEHLMVRHEAAIALGVIGDEQSLPALEQAATETELSVVESAKYALAEVRTRMAKLVPIL
jgi:HEAT repeat protein